MQKIFFPDVFLKWIKTIPLSTENEIEMEKIAVKTSLEILT